MSPLWKKLAEHLGLAPLWGSSAAPTGPMAHRGAPPRPAAAGCASPQALGRVLPGRRDVLIGWAVVVVVAAAAHTPLIQVLGRQTQLDRSSRPTPVISALRRLRQGDQDSKAVSQENQC